MRSPIQTRRAPDEAFYDWTAERPVVQFHGQAYRGPITAHRYEAFQAVFPASYARVVETLPTEDLSPVRWRDGRAVLFVAGTRMADISLYDERDTVIGAQPYGETNIGVLVSERPVPRMLGLLGTPRAFILQLPVTTIGAADAGRTYYNDPKFVTDMDFVEAPTARSVVVAEGGRTLLRLEVRPSGHVSTVRSSMYGYSAMEGQLLRTEVRVLGHWQRMLGPRSARLELGDHAVADQLRRLQIDTTPLMAASYLDAKMRFGAPVPVGTARPYHGYVVEHEPDRGRFTVAYPDTPPIDQYTVPRDATPLAAEHPVTT